MKRSIRNGFLTLFVLGSAQFWGCSDDTQEQMETRMTIECDLLSEDYIMLESGNMDPSLMTVSSTHKWVISKSDLDWLTVTPVTGAAQTEVQVIFSPEINTGDERQGTLLFNYGGKERSITVIQGAFVLIPKIEFVDYDEEPIEFDYNGSAPVTIKVKSNVAWNATASVPDVVLVSPTSGAANQVTTVTITPLDNLTTDIRSTVLTFKDIASDEKVQLSINQAEYPSTPEFKLDNIEDKKLVFSAIPGEKSFDVTANFDWEVQGSVPAWLEISPTSGLSDQKVTLVVKTLESNSTGATRDFTLTLAAQDSEITLTESIQVIQGVTQTFYYDDISWSDDPNVTAPFSVIGLLKSLGRRAQLFFTTSSPQYISTDKLDPLLNGMEVLRVYTDLGSIRVGESSSAGRYSTPYFNGVYPATNTFLEGQKVMPDFMPNTAATLTFNMQHFGSTQNSTVTVVLSYSDGTPSVTLLNTGNVGKAWDSDPFQNWYQVTANISAEEVGVGNCRIDIGTASGNIVFIDDVRLATADPAAVTGVAMLPAKNLVFCRDARPTYVATLEEAAKVLASSASEEFSITIDHNVDFEIASKPDWVSVVSTGTPMTLGSGSRTIVTLEASANTTGSSRSGVIEVRGSAHPEATHSLTVTQP